MHINTANCKLTPPCAVEDPITRPMAIRLYAVLGLITQMQRCLSKSDVKNSFVLRPLSTPMLGMRYRNSTEYKI
jgi:hypothetical protein